jgi:probable addiction module antidote protein
MVGSRSYRLILTQITGLKVFFREQLYQSFSQDGNPTLKTVFAVMKALGGELTAKLPVAA